MSARIHIKAHNKAVQRSGFFASCKRAKGQHLNEIAIRVKLNK